MGQLVLGVAGAVAGSFIPGVGPSIGFAVASAIGGALFQPKLPTIRNAQQPLSDLRVVGTEYGQPIPFILSRALVAGQIWWNTDRRVISSTTSQTTGGKGGGPEQTTETTTITYDIDMLIGLCDVTVAGAPYPIAGVSRIFDNGKLIFSADSDALSGTLDASQNAGQWDRLTVYTGTYTQLPDPTYEAAVGTANAPAYRGRAYVFIQGLKLGQSGAVRNLTFEVVQDGTAQTTHSITPVILGSADDTDQYEGQDYQYMGVRGSGVVWSVHNEDELDESLRLIDVSNGSIVQEFTQEDAADSPTPQTINPFRPVGISLNGSAFMRNAGGNNIITRFGVDGTVGHINTIFDASSIGLAEDSLGNLWGMNATTNVLNRINEPHFSGTPSGPSTSPAVPTESGADKVNRWARNPSGIGDHVIGISGGADPNRLIKAGPAPSLSVSFLGTDHIASGTQVVVGDDELVYTVAYPGGSISRIEQRSGVTGAVVDSVDIDMSASGDFQLEPQLYDANGFLWVGGKDEPLAPFLKIDTSGMTVSDTFDNPSLDIGDSEGYRKVTAEPIEGVVAVDRSGFGGLGLIRVFDTIEKQCITVAEAVTRLCLRSGLVADQFDVADLNDITLDVCSLAVSQITSSRTPLELLMATYFFELTVSDKIYFRPRGVSEVAEIEYHELGATTGDFQPEPLPLKQINDLELPAQIALTYLNLENDYQPDTQYSDRLISAVAGTVNAVQMPIGLSPSQAKQVADVMLLDQVASGLTTSFSLLGDYSRLEPTDPVIVAGKNDEQFRMRIVKKTDSFPLLSFDAVLDDTSVLISQGITSSDFESQTIVTGGVDTLMRLLDIPILRDADNDTGFYITIKGDDTPYPGALIMDSDDGETFARRLTLQEVGIFGSSTTTLGDWPGARMIDELNTVTVNVGDAELSSSTREAILDNQAINACAIGIHGRWELLQYITATLLSPGVYRLSRLLRGSRGTEWAVGTHTGGEQFVALRTIGVRRILTQNNQLGVERHYLGVTLGRNISTGTQTSFTNNGVGLKPVSPVDLRASRDPVTGDITFTWQRRTRMSVRMIGALGISVPLGEESEAYELDIMPVGSPASVVRTISASTTSAVYTSAQQVADFGSNQSSVRAAVFQLSAAVGRGYEYEAVV